MVDQKIYGTEYDILMFCWFLNILLDAYTSSLVNNKDGESRCELPMHLEEIMRQIYFFGITKQNLKNNNKMIHSKE